MKMESNKDNEIYDGLDRGSGYEESEYYGVFGYDLSGNWEERLCYKTIDIDPERYQEILGKFSPEQLEVMNKRNTRYFRPAKAHKTDYNCNVFLNVIESIKSDWNGNFKGLIQRERDRIKKPKELVPADDEYLMCGITDYEESAERVAFANIRNGMKYRNEVFNNVNRLYAMFLHEAATRIEGVTIKVL